MGPLLTPAAADGALPDAVKSGFVDEMTSRGRSLSPQPSSDDDLAAEIGLNAHEYLEECFYNEVSVLDRDKFDAIPEFVKSDLTILVSATAASATGRCLGHNLDRRGHGLGHNLGRCGRGRGRGHDLVHRGRGFTEDAALATILDLVHRPHVVACCPLHLAQGHLGKGSFSDVFEVVCNSQLGTDTGGKIPGEQQQQQQQQQHAPPGGERPAQTPDPGGLVRRSSSSRRGNPLGGSLGSRTLAKPSQAGESPNLFAMKCLRPQIRSDVDQFTIGSEDLVHETAILANLSHEHIIKLYGRAAGHLTDAFVLNDGYFILLDKLRCTLTDRIHEWRDAGQAAKGPEAAQLGVARDTADAVVYLHSRKIVFRDLKPANVGFNERGVLKLFDFGFAVGLPEDEEGNNPDCLLYDRCGTPRYMAPEVSLDRGYGLASDVYSFGILLWEVCALSRPFGGIASAEEFEETVFMGGERPPLGRNWSQTVKVLMSKCWVTRPDQRPSILNVRAALSAATDTPHGKKKSAMKTIRSSMTKSMTKRFSM